MIASMTRMCCNCKRIHDEELKTWRKPIEEVSEEITHGICPECVKILYPSHIVDAIIAS